MDKDNYGPFRWSLSTIKLFKGLWQHAHWDRTLFVSIHVLTNVAQELTPFIIEFILDANRIRKYSVHIKI
jgi:hypothetical protein